ncbi:MAG: alcohol dehydrogenase catalytic domain-containing protein [Syntrophaceae bacterium]|nr:alcohol dehydrogenase catalytic domain-containing protein [Syntrophaceae bacterium]
MKALVFDGQLSVKDIHIPVPRDDEALVKVGLAGICMTDKEIVKGYMNFNGVLGHEFVGHVESAKDPSLLGKRVVGDINAGCMRCEFCLKGLQRHCSNRSVLGILSRNGAFAEYLTLPVGNLHIVPENIPDESAVFVEPLAAALEIAEQIHVEPNLEVLIVGDGRLALLTCMVLRLTGCSITVLGKHADKLKMFEAYSVNTMLFKDIDGMDKSYDMVVEASGNPSGWQTAVKLVKPRGVIALKSTYHGDFSFNPAPLVINEVSVIGSRCGQFEPALRLLSSGLVDPRHLISGIFEIDDSLRAFEAANSSNVFKILIKML